LENNSHKIIIILGVSGCGKTTIGRLLATETGFDFYDADDFHPKSNIDKMKNNIPLTDEDRFPWLHILANKMQKWNTENNFVLACSALKESYRQILASNFNNILWIYLEGDPDLIASRLGTRKGHFMKPVLLSSQFEALEIPNYGLHIPIKQSPSEILKTIKSKLKLDEKI